MQYSLQFESHPTIIHGFEFQETTMQVPCGQYSILSELHKKKVTAAEAITYLALNHASSWNSGMTWVHARTRTFTIARSPYVHPLREINLGQPL